MKITKENITRKLDSLGRVSIPKAMRQRLEIDDLSEVEFYTLEDDNGMQYVCISNNKVVNNDYAKAAKVLEELGLEVPQQLREKL